MAADIVYPILIGVGALLIGVVVHFLTRPKPSRADIAVPATPTGHGSSAASTTELGAWHRAHEAALLHFIDRFDAIGGFGPDLDEIDGAEAGGDGAAGDEADGNRTEPAVDGSDGHDDESGATPAACGADAIDAAISDHPAPDMRAELAALRGAADAMADARERDDGEALERHLPVYLSYRAAWLERLWQFPIDGAHIAALRDREVPPADED